MSEAHPLAPPPEPESIEQTGISETTLERLILKILYFRGELYGQDLSNAIGLKFSVIQEIIESLKIQFQVVVKRSLGKRFCSRQQKRCLPSRAHRSRVSR